MLVGQHANKLIVPVYDSRTNCLEEGGNDKNHGGSTNNDTIGSVNQSIVSELDEYKFFFY